MANQNGEPESTPAQESLSTANPLLTKKLPEGEKMKLDRAINLDDLRRMAKRRLPKIAYDFIEGGADDEDGLDRAVDAFRSWRIVPRFMVDVSQRKQNAIDGADE